ncbi:MAG: alpha-galactosidase, partial [Acidobacteria bacterium]|nr:alpha-galactosidase [Acidobacteriota bacterium]
MKTGFIAIMMTLPLLASPGSSGRPIQADWLVAKTAVATAVHRGPHPNDIELSNGLIRRQWRLAPNAATVAFDNLTNRQALIRAVKPEAVIEIDGCKYAVGGLQGQPEHGYLRREWLDQMTADPAAFQFAGYETGTTVARLEWKRVRYAENRPWPPPGAALALRFTAPGENLKGLQVVVHYEMYDGIPLLAKWLEVRNGTQRALRLNTFTSEILAVAECHSAAGETDAQEANPNTSGNAYIQVETDYAFVANHPRDDSSGIAEWGPDKEYTTQVAWRLDAPLLLRTRPPVGPDALIPPGGAFETFRIFELIHDSTERERRGLALRRMYRTLAPWVTENPILMHVRQADPASVRLAIDQCAETGFEMVIMSFGSGFNIENEDPVYLAQVAGLVRYARSKGVELGGVRYARSKGVELGGYSLLASRKISAEDDVINPKTGKTGGAIFGDSPCLGSRWGLEYFRKLTSFIEKTGIGILEHDGSYPGDLCASATHPGHRGLEDSQWTQWKKIADFYHWCRARGVYLNVPDWYFLTGSNKSAMGYRESNWSLPRERQIILGRQNIFDGTWAKTPSMGWMFVPLVQYHGGGAAATLEPLHEHLDAYGAHLAQNFA